MRGQGCASAAVLAAALCLGACGAPVDEPLAAPAPAKKAAAPAAEALGGASLPPDALAYRCDNGERLRAAYPSPEVAIVQYRGELHRLTLARSASGARYTDDTRQWWTKGEAEGTISRLKPEEDIASEPGVACRLETARPPETMGARPES
ncbi:MliC family protein [Phenylobacterium sp.]|uniref:MliC family protein n=1 Tax=Phenylobacterium sp. TaxID=1871053 RepID=UPI002FDA11E2